MTEVSPKIAFESQVLTVPVFLNKSLFPSCRSTTRASTVSVNSTTSVPSCITRSYSDQSLIDCKCSHVLVADDDPFQEFYYQTLLQKSIDFEDSKVEKKDFRFKVLKSGEELLSKFAQLKACNCGTTLLVITDYYMGCRNINGIETAAGLRKLGFKGPIFLRTSESKEDLQKEHQDLDRLLQEGIIDCILSKENHLETKRSVQNVLGGKNEE